MQLRILSMRVQHYERDRLKCLLLIEQNALTALIKVSEWVLIQRDCHPRQSHIGWINITLHAWKRKEGKLGITNALSTVHYWWAGEITQSHTGTIASASLGNSIQQSCTWNSLELNIPAIQTWYMIRWSTLKQDSILRWCSYGLEWQEEQGWNFFLLYVKYSPSEFASEAQFE